MTRSPHPQEDPRSTQTDLDAQQAIEQSPARNAGKERTRGGGEMAAHKGNLWTKEEVFEALQAAYKRGVAFACEGAGINDEGYVALWKYVPKAAYDYADKATGPDGV